MRQGFSKVIGQAICEGRLPWLLRQAAKYVGIECSHCFLKGGTLVGPLMGVLILTNRCNSRCAMCDITTRPCQELSFDQAREVIRQLMEVGSSGIGITGGEPLLHPDIFPLTAYARSFGVPVTLNTNGLLLHKPGLIEELLQAGPTNVNISLDGGTAETHNSLRGGDFFDRTLEGIRELSARARERGSRTTVTVVTVISERNYRELPQLVELVAQSGAHRLGVMPLHNTRQGTSIRVLPSAELAHVPAYLRRLESVPLDNSVAYLRALEDAWAGKPFPRPCNAGYTSLFVDANLNMYPCLGNYMMGRPMTELHLEAGAPSIKDIWYAPQYRKVRRELNACRMCYLNCQAELSFLVPLLF